MSYSVILWDFNGTLLNDVDICKTAINIMLKKRGLPLLSTQQYRENFDFPIINSYKRAGFDFKQESFDSIANEFGLLYFEFSKDKLLVSPEILDLLKFFKEKGVRQFVISASELALLKKQLCLMGISDYFENINGLENFYAESKVELCQKWFSAYPDLNPADILFIGDTVHDFETARGIECDSVLLSFGHQDKKRLLTCNVPVFDNAKDMFNYVSELI